MKEQDWTWIQNNLNNLKNNYLRISKDLSKATDEDINNLKNNFMNLHTYVKNKSQDKKLIKRFQKWHKIFTKLNKDISDSEKRQIERIFNEIEDMLKQLHKAA